MSWKAEVIADSTDTWTGNGLTFATQKEAEDYVSDLSWRWTSVRKTRVVESDLPVNCEWVDGKATHIKTSDL